MPIQIRMLISHTNQFIYIHLLKTAGTSVSRQLAPYARFIDHMVYGTWPTNKLFIAFNILTKRKGIEYVTGFTKHATALDIKSKLPVNTWESYFKFAFVRNPWDVCVSLYFYLSQNFKLPSHKIIRSQTFPEFIEWYVNTRPRRQIDFLSDSDGGILVDYVGRYERLKEDLQFVADKLKLRINQLPHSNISKKRLSKDYRKYYDTITVESVNEYFRKDIEMFGYRFE